MLKNLLIVFLTINALFWGLADHGSHCSLAAAMGISKCPSHTVHLIMGLLFFVAAIYVAQKEYIDSLF